MGKKASDKRWDEAIDALLNGRWVEPEAIQVVFAYQDGEIDRDEMKRRLA